MMQTQWMSTNSKPAPYDIVNVKCDEDKIKQAWWSGYRWENAKGDLKTEVVMWQKHYIPRDTMKR